MHAAGSAPQWIRVHKTTLGLVVESQYITSQMTSLQPRAKSLNVKNRGERKVVTSFQRLSLKLFKGLNNETAIPVSFNASMAIVLFIVALYVLTTAIKL